MEVLTTTDSSYSFSICSGENYNFNGLLLDSSGNYTDTLVSSNSCDSIIYLNLIVNQNSQFNHLDSICLGDSMFFNNNFYTQPGLYYDTLINAFGCDSVLGLNLVQLDTSLTINDTILNPGTYLIFNGDTISQSGAYMAIFQNMAGCDSNVKLNIQITQNILNLLDFKSIHLFPNPCESYISFNIDINEFKFEIYDMNLAIIQNGLIKNNKIDTSKLSAGIYFLSIKNENIKRNFKLIKK